MAHVDSRKLIHPCPFLDLSVRFQGLLGPQSGLVPFDPVRIAWWRGAARALGAAAKLSEVAAFKRCACVSCAYMVYVCMCMCVCVYFQVCTPSICSICSIYSILPTVSYVVPEIYRVTHASDNDTSFFFLLSCLAPTLLPSPKDVVSYCPVND